MAFTHTEISDIERQLKKRGFAAQFPVGAIFITVSGENPSRQLGYGTWSRFAAGRTLVGVSSTDADFATANRTGGSKTVTPSAHTGTAVAAHSPHTHGLIPQLSGSSANFDPGTDGALTDVSGAYTTTDEPNITLSHTVTQPSPHDAMSVLQPYVTVHFWRRVA